MKNLKTKKEARTMKRTIEKMRVNIGLSAYILLSMLFFSPSYAQNTWCKRIGGSNWDVGYSIIQTTDGGYAIAGGTNSFGAGSEDVYVIKLNANGSIEWTRTIGGDSIDYGYSIIQTIDGGYAITGGTVSFGAGWSDVYVIKLNANGNIEWTKTIGGSNWDEGYSIIQTIDSGYVIAGRTLSFGAGLEDVYVIKLSANGNIEWTKTIGGSNWDGGFSIIQTIDGGYAITGGTVSFGAGYEDVYVIKLSANGNIEWTKTIGGSNSDWGWSIIQTTDGGYAIAGRTTSFGAGGFDVYVIKLDTSGNIQWTKTIGGSSWDYGRSIIQTTDGGYAIAGEANSFGAGDYDVYVIKLDTSGNIQWTKTIGGSYEDWGYSIIQTTDGGYAIAGVTRSFGAGWEDVYVIKLSASGNTCTDCGIKDTISSFSDPNSSESSPTLTENIVNSTVNSGGNVSSGGTEYTICSSNIIESNFDKSASYCYSNGKVKIHFKKAYDKVSIIIRDITGREVMRKEFRNKDSIEIDINGKDGIYFIEVKSGNNRSVFKVVKSD